MFVSEACQHGLITSESNILNLFHLSEVTQLKYIKENTSSLGKAQFDESCLVFQPRIELSSWFSE